MTYLEKLNPWCIVRHFPTMQNKIIARFRRRNDAESHLKALDRLIPNATFSIIFNMSSERQN